MCSDFAASQKLMTLCLSCACIVTAWERTASSIPHILLFLCLTAYGATPGKPQPKIEVNE
jgi:hypothetical protein